MRIHHTHPQSPMNISVIHHGGRRSVGEFMRRWGPYVLTALLVPGGIVIALLVWWSRGQFRRETVRARLQYLPLRKSSQRSGEALRKTG